MRWTEEELAEYQRGKKVQKKPTAKEAMQALGRLKTGKMNKTEAEYEGWLRTQPSVVWFKFEGVKLKLADNTTYTPDFAVMLWDGRMEMHEVKGFWQDDARVKIKVAAEMFPFKFKAIKKKAQKNGGGWEVEEF